MIRIDRCICFQKTFASLKQVAERTESMSVEALQEHTAFGKNCQLCLPYVKRMLETGETVFSEVIGQ